MPLNKTISGRQLIERIMEMEKRGATFVTIQTVTDPRMVKKSRTDGTPNPYLGAKKVTVINGAFGTSYESCVNRQQKREGGEGDFEAGARAWGQHYKGSKTVIFHQGAFYLSLRPLNVLSVDFLFKGRPIDKALLEPFLPLENIKAIAESQGVERAVRCTDYALANIKQITIDKETYTLV